ncbi:protein NUCLEAR FUSION DEFECTIVE 4-like isoform X1 [Actinidia eriantha]|uniref:protein NUCLEAR FUSION DEFECTIVE 4-like isoform X1 n=1 Tax=Actinidia eriantha TaxID=165200 RepID=UPI002585334E|nr:protein NUCLEAR FUSION DEFECTIVE 4-like isoform X1 [Actinidia eriantha]XP_057466377.1 protein NUCLEAR FUSION DEFECTIVE 4-like isoform X1 [Actinidia eriantha]XP_057466378.1 protein NUCLEAR FUSION DEFECTIVE 4-like isoform X1 [Actinidia eriantha]
MGSTSDSKWTATVASIWIQSTSGSLYTFGIYSAALKSSLSYDQSTLATLSAFKDAGANAGLLSGLLYSAATSTNPRTTAACGGGGPWIVLLAGAIQCFAGYFLMWLSVTGVIPPPHVLVMCLYMLLAAHAGTFFNTANVVTAVNNFPNYRGTVVGIMKGFLGLSGAILIQVYQTIFKNKPTLYLLMLALLPTFNTLLLMCFVRIYRTSEGDEKKHLNGFSLVSLIIAAYLMVVIILENAFSLQLSARIFTFIILILLLASPLYIAMKSQRSDLRSISSTTLIGGDRLVDDPQQLVAENIHTRHDLGMYHQVPDGADQERDTDDKKTMQWGENMNLLQAMCTNSFWLLFVATACGMGSGLATVNNISQIGGSLGYTDFETSSLVSLWSIWNFLGRFGAGYVSEYFLHVNGWPRPLFMAITLATMSIGHAVIASGFAGALYVGSILVGVCYGSQWSLMPTIASEIFGVVHMGTIFNTITIASPVGSYILSVRVVGYIYDKEASGEGNICSGTHCFRFSFFILAGAAILGCLAALILFFLTKKFYQQSVLRRLQNSAWE